jgi:hypothetical protein
LPGTGLARIVVVKQSHRVPLELARYRFSFIKTKVVEFAQSKHKGGTGWCLVWKGNWGRVIPMLGKGMKSVPKSGGRSAGYSMDTSGNHMSYVQGALVLVK